MIESKAWDWNEADTEIWRRPSDELYPVADRWRRLGYRRVLDLGCGMGRNALFLAECGFSVVAYDLSASGIAKLETRISVIEAETGILPDISLGTGDMLALPYDGGSFDAVVAFHVIYHTTMDGLQRVVAEIHRVLRPAGELFVTFNSKTASSYTDPGSRVVDEHTLVKTSGFESGIPHTFVNADDLAGILKSFDMVKMQHIQDFYGGGSGWHYFILSRKSGERVDLPKHEQAARADPASPTAAAEEWTKRIDKALPGIIAGHPGLGEVRDRCIYAFYGSLSRGIADEFADIDLVCLLEPDAYRRASSNRTSDFFDFTLDGRKGHVTVEPITDWTGALESCKVETIFEMRFARLLAGDPAKSEARDRLTRQFRDAVARANRPPSETARRRLFFHHYVQFRSAHRAAQDPMNRQEPHAVFMFLGLAMAQAFRAALILEGKPFPYEKWLRKTALETETGRSIAGYADHIISLLGSGALRREGGERENPLSQTLRQGMRRALMEAARDSGIDEPWLDRWWEHIGESRAALQEMSW